MAIFSGKKGGLTELTDLIPHNGIIMKSCKIISCLSVGAILAVSGGILFGLRGTIFSSIINGNFKLSPDSSLYPTWDNLPPLTTKIYFFNVTNAAAVEKRGAKPILVEVGPYVYEERHKKTKVVWNNDNFTVTYQNVRSYFFDRSASVGPEEDIITTLNAPAAIANGIGATMNKALRPGLSAALLFMGEKLFVKRSVRELVTVGYKDPLLTDTSWLPKSVVPVKMDKFGYFYPRNGTDWYDGVYNMFTGEDDVNKLGKVVRWNYTDHFAFSGKCGKVRGYGDIISPGQDGTTLDLNQEADMCRPITLEYVTSGDVPGMGMKGSRYEISPKFFANKTVNPDNACYAAPKAKEVPSGVLDISQCKWGAPLFMSQPHFYQADPFFVAQVGGGLNPEKEKHETFIWLDRDSGVPMSLVVRLQVNFLIQKLPEILLYQDITTTYFPTVWFEVGMEVEGSMKTEVWLLVHMRTILLSVGIALFVIGLVLLVGVGVAYVHNKNLLPTLVVARKPSGSESGNPILNENLLSDSEPQTQPERDGQPPDEIVN